jgi:hypothetical protein
MSKYRPGCAKGRQAWLRAWPLVTLGFAAVVFGAVALDSESVVAQEVKKSPAPVGKKAYAPASKGLPVAKSLTNGQKVDSAALTRLIDQEINKRLRAEKVSSAGLCDDAEFLRRVYLDLVGMIPTADQAAAFLNSKEPNKRAKLVDHLLADSRFGHTVGETWANMMVPRESNNRALNPKAFEEWLAAEFNKNTPLDKLVYSIVTATGEIDKNPAVTYFVANPTVDKVTDNSTRLFLGVQLQCAQCHNHPFTDWKQTEYWAMAAFYMKTRANATPQAAAKKGTVLTVSESNVKGGGKKGALPESAKIVPAKFLQGEQPKLDPTGPLRPTLGKWITSSDNKFFARAMVNRFWYQMFGRGIVNPVDDMHDDNAASHPELLVTLTEQFKINGFDVKYLVRSICNSEAYQRSSVSKGENVEPDLYARREIRVLGPEQLFDSLVTVLGNTSARSEGGGKTGKKGGPATPRGNFVTFFRVDDANPLEYQSGIPQALRMLNSTFTNRADVTAAEIIRGTKTPAEAIERIYLCALSRRPTTAEVERLTAYVNRPVAAQRAAYGDVLWALLNTSEFVLNH